MNHTTMIETEELLNTQVVRDYVCAACHSELVERRINEVPMICCANDPAHRGFTKRMTAWVEERKETLVETKTKETMALVATEQEQEIERWAKRMDRFPLVGPQDKVKLIKYMAARMAVVYGMDPFLGELVIIPHKKDGQVVDLSLYASVGGMRRVARRTGDYEGRELTPATKKERLDLKITDDGVHVWKCLVYRRGYPRPFDGFGIFPMLKQDAYSPADPALMARKRAEHQALRAAFDLNIPLFEPEIEQEKPFEVTIEQPPSLNARQIVEDASAELQRLIDEARGVGVPDVKIVQALEGLSPEEAEAQAQAMAAQDEAWREEHGITGNGEPPLEEQEQAAQFSPAEEIYGPQEPEEPQEPEKPQELEKPGVNLFWKFYNEEVAGLVSLKDAQAILNEGPTVLEAIEALRVAWQAAIAEQEGSG